MANRLEKLADDLMGLSQDEAQQLQTIIKAKLMPEVERQRGLLQDQMQKNLSCRNLGDAQKNMFTFSTILIFVDLLFLSLGAILYIYSNQFGIVIPDNPDMLFPNIALNAGLPAFVGVLFIIGIIAIIIKFLN